MMDVQNIESFSNNALTGLKQEIIGNKQIEIPIFAKQAQKEKLSGQLLTFL
jgi:hypothetical protein